MNSYNFEQEIKSLLVKMGYYRYEDQLWAATDASDPPEHWRDIVLDILRKEV